MKQASPEVFDRFVKYVAKHLGLIFEDDDPVWSSFRRVLITGGIRAGKSTRGAFKAFMESLNPNCRLIWLVGPDYQHAQEEFRMLMDWYTKFDMLDPSFKPSVPQEGSRRMKLITGCLIETRSAQHPERLASVAPDGIILCEPGQMPYEVYDICLGRLTERRGWLFMVGTLEDDEAEGAKRRWAWYEKLATDWAARIDGQEKSYTVPSWTNKFLYPLGFDDPEIQERLLNMSEYRFWRMYGGKPMGVEHPVFPLLHEPHAAGDYKIPCDMSHFNRGAIGVDYGRTFNHPSTVVVVQIDDLNRYWVRHAWSTLRADPDEIISVVRSLQDFYGVFEGCADPNQDFLAKTLGFKTAAGGAFAGKPSEMRMSLTNGLLESRQLYFDSAGEGIEDVWYSLQLCRRQPNARGELVYNRPIGDDYAQALMYAIECLRGNNGPLPQLQTFGATRIYYEHEEMGGRI